MVCCIKISIDVDTNGEPCREEKDSPGRAEREDQRPCIGVSIWSRFLPEVVLVPLAYVTAGVLAGLGGTWECGSMAMLRRKEVMAQRR